MPKVLLYRRHLSDDPRYHAELVDKSRRRGNYWSALSADLNYPPTEEGLQAAKDMWHLYDWRLADDHRGP